MGEALVSIPGVFDDLFKANKKEAPAANGNAHDEELQSIRQRAVEGLQRLSEQGNLESLLQESTEATSRSGHCDAICEETGAVRAKESHVIDQANPVIDIDSIRKG